MFLTLTPPRVAAALDAVTEYRTHLGDDASRGLLVLQRRLGDLSRGVVTLTEPHRALLVRALLRHPAACPSPDGCDHDGPIGELLLILAGPPINPRKPDLAAVADVGRLYYLGLGDAHVVGECLSVSGGPDEGGQYAHLRVWTTATRRDITPVVLQSVTAQSWCLAAVDPFA